MVKPLVITTGEPAGIGMDVVIDSFTNQPKPCHWLVLCDASELSARAKLLGVELAINTGPAPLGDHSLWVHHLPCVNPVTPGVLDPANGGYVLDQLRLAHQLAISAQASAIVTAPLQKSLINQAIELGLTECELPNNYFPGHTEFFEQLSCADQVVMMLANTKARVALVTTHLPLKDVPAAVTAHKITQVLNVLLSDLQRHFAISDPTVLVCGLNPHAGEGGHMGLEEVQIINPTLKQFTDQGHRVVGPLPADTAFTPKYLEQADAFLAMYHDQGLTAVKTLGFGQTVNVTLGLPYVRTSVDHGTALDLAGTGLASSSSFLAAIHLAESMGSAASPSGSQTQ